MKKLALSILLICVLFESFAQDFCLTKSIKSSNARSMFIAPSQPCKLYWIRVYIHRINTTSGNGYTSSIDNTIMNTLNSSLNSFGFYFVEIGSRTWYDDTFGSPNTDPLVLQNIPNSSSNGFQSNTINIYVLPANSQISGGFVPNSNKQILLIGGTRNVTHCQPTQFTAQYVIANTKVVCHEMGHCFGLVHTFETNGDDGLPDTPLDYVTNSVGGQGCINPTSCLFTGSCTTCSLSSNPTTSMNNYMSYTIPSCMSYFSVQQMDVMRYSLNGSLTNVVSSTLSGSPNLQAMSRDGGIAVNTVNSISSGYHTVNTNLDPGTLTGLISWMPSTNSVWWGTSGTNNVNAWLQPNSGQSISYNITANNICGTSNRNVTFAVQSGFRIISNGAIKNEVIIQFDNPQFIETLPESILLIDEKTLEKEKEIKVKEIFDKKQFIDKDKISIDVKKLSRGTKFLHFIFQKTNEDVEIIKERILLID